ncbi:hypothetical protein [Bacillus pumilus]|uniref:hypothetical protein n=1 Tax=Bacillus pumilus TaxID=1408 RepID=UPI0007EEDBE1|nr:hypothetical protein [Bacillus pumilus]OBS85775.1 hypothetical protein BAY68_19340 [Bacillus pumilus]
MGITEFIRRVDDLLDTKLEYEIKTIRENEYINDKEYVEERTRNEHIDYREEMMAFIDSQFGGK